MRQKGQMMALHRKISRRSLIAGAGVAAAAAAAGALNPSDRRVFAAVGTATTTATAGSRGRLIPPDKVGTITFTQRDVPGRVGIAASAARGVAPTMGFLGGPNFPEDPTDLGPLVPLPGGWQELFEFLADAGFKQIEFAGYGQNADQPRRRRPATRRRRRDAPESRRPTSPTPGRCAASSTTSASRRSATTASSRTPGPGRTARAAP